MAAKIRRDDEVIVITGKDKGKRGRVLKVLPTENRVVVEGVILSRNTRSQCLSLILQVELLRKKRQFRCQI